MKNMNPDVQTEPYPTPSPGRVATTSQEGQLT